MRKQRTCLRQDFGFTVQEACRKFGTYWVVGPDAANADNAIIKFEVVIIGQAVADIQLKDGSNIKIETYVDVSWQQYWRVFDNYWFAYAYQLKLKAKRKEEADARHPIHP